MARDKPDRHTREPEAKLEALFVRRVESMGGIALKLEVQSRRGWMDRLVILPYGVTFFIEIKIQDGRMSKLQRLRRRQLTELGHNAMVLWSRAEVANWARTARAAIEYQKTMALSIGLIAGEHRAIHPLLGELEEKGK